MPSIFSWSYHSPYGRTRRLQAAPFVARTDSNISRVATTMANQPNPGDVVINMDGNSNDKQDTLFGPNVGIMSTGPKWTESLSEKKPAQDELTPEIVKRWIDKSKEAVQPTTTLQALVNLKRPTLRITPLQVDPADDIMHADAHDHHALEFEYDCDAPKCSITVAVVLPSDPAHPDGRMPVYEGVFDGGFGRALRLSDGATLELGRFAVSEAAPATHSPEPSKGESPVINATPSPATAASSPPLGDSSEREQQQQHRRFAMPFRRRHNPQRSVAGPAIAVLDVDTHATGEPKDKEEERDEGGVRALITLIALDESGAPVQPANSQTTYLHVMRYGLRNAEGEDTRPWVVKVVKREATIGPHTFHLHEIYGLSSSAATAHPSAPTAPLPDVNTYPPTSAAIAAAAAAPVEDEPSSECLLCLSAPREVVLLPCRHLVACKECALNMVEFGAGGQIVHNEEPSAPETPAQPAVPAPAVASTSAPVPEPEAPAPVASAPEPAPTAEGAASPPASRGEGENATPETPAPAPAATAPTTAAPTTQPRRKRRAKGWFCPVCRQPYTSLLRITTVPPSPSDAADGKRVSTSTVDHPLATPAPAHISSSPTSARAPVSPTSVRTPTSAQGGPVPETPATAGAERRPFLRAAA